MTLIFQDTFTEAVDTPLTSHTPDIGTGWVEVYNTMTSGYWLVSAANGWVNVTGEQNSAGVAARINPDPPGPEYDIQLTLARGEGDAETGSKPTGVFFRRVDASNQYVFRQLPNSHSDNSQSLWVQSGGAWTLLASIDTPEVEGDQFKIEVRDAAKKLYKNGVEILSTPDNTITGAGSVGLWIGNYMGSGHARAPYAWDDFSVTLAGAAGVNVDVSPAQLSLVASDVTPFTLGTPVNVDVSPAQLSLLAQGVTPSTVSLPVNVNVSPAQLSLLARRATPVAEATKFSWRVLVDWDGNGLFANAYSDVSDRWLNMNWRNGARQAFQPMSDEAEAQIELRNTDGRYNPENTASPLYGKVLPGRLVKIVAVYGQQERTMYVGRIHGIQSDWVPGSGDYSGKSRAILDCVGWKQQLQELDYFPPIWWNQNAGYIISYVLGQLGVPMGTIEGGLTKFPYFGDMGVMKAWDLIQEVVVAERGRFFQDRKGNATFWNRHHLLHSKTPVGTVSYTSGKYKPYHVTYQYAHLVSNRVHVQANPRTLGTSTETLWSLERPIYIPAGGSREFVVTLRRESGQPAASESLSVSAITFSQGAGTVNVTEKGATAVVTVTNTSAYEPATLSALTLTGTVTVNQNTLAVEMEDTASVAAYGLRGYQTLNLTPVQDYDEIRQIALYELHRRAQPFGAVTDVTFRRKADGVDNQHLYEWEIGTRITVDVPAQGSARDYWIIGEEHYLMPGGLHEAIFHLEPADPQQYWLVGVTGYGELNVNTRVAY